MYVPSVFSDSSSTRTTSTLERRFSKVSEPYTYRNSCTSCKIVAGTSIIVAHKRAHRKIVAQGEREHCLRVVHSNTMSIHINVQKQQAVKRGWALHLQLVQQCRQVQTDTVPGFIGLQPFLGWHFKQPSSASKPRTVTVHSKPALRTGPPVSSALQLYTGWAGC